MTIARREIRKYAPPDFRMNGPASARTGGAETEPQPFARP
jgi:hypothetical protein